jgi:uncharacterized membrane protein (DUF485 family)
MKHPAPEPPDIHSESFLHLLMRRQLKLSIACALTFLLALLGLPLANYYAPDLMATRILGFTLTWLILGVLFFPFVWIISYVFIRRSIALEDAEVAETKLQIPNPKSQTNSKTQTPNSNGPGAASALLLGFGFWNLFGIWTLVFGI